MVAVPDDTVLDNDSRQESSREAEDSSRDSCGCDDKGKKAGKKGTMRSAEEGAAAMFVASLLIIVAVEMLFSFGLFRAVPGFIGKYWQYILYITIAVSAGGAAVWHIRAYRKTFNCSLGMMVGMTIGMLAGFAFGAIIGATNGMFVGSVYGMAVGMFAGAWCTRRCGIMSIMEGLMAGFMGGLMGAMTTVMMIADNLAIAMPILVGGCALILGGMVYMIRKESEGHDIDARFDIYDAVIFMSVLIMLAFATTAIMAYGPKAAIVGL